VDVSQNGWPVLQTSDTVLWQVPGVARHLRLAPGAPGFLLTHLALWFHEQIEPLDTGAWDDWAHSIRMVTGSTRSWSNHASGTAIDLNAQAHPYGSRNTFEPRESRRIRRRLKGAYRDTIRWGGDYEHTPDEMHFEIAASRPEVVAAARRLRFSPRGRRISSVNVGVRLS
jgi:hypothetical protein